MADNRYGGAGRGESWRGRDSSIFSGDDGDRSGRGSARWSGEQGRGSRSGEEDRGFFERAGDEVRSWFGDDDAERRRERDLRQSEGRSNFGGEDYGRDFERGSHSQGRTSSQYGFGESSQREQGFGQGGGGFSGPNRYGDQIGSGRSPHSSDQQKGGQSGSFMRSEWDDNYRRWREQQLQQFDSEYEDYCRERQQQFDRDFHSWRNSRLTQGGTGGSFDAGADTGGGSSSGAILHGSSQSGDRSADAPSASFRSGEAAETTDGTGAREAAAGPNRGRGSSSRSSS